MATKVAVYATGSTITIPMGATGIIAIHAIGAGQNGVFGDSARGGHGGGWAVLNNPSLATFVPGSTYDIQIGQHGTSNGEAGGNTWIKNGSGTIVLLAPGGGAAESPIGDAHNLGGVTADATGGDFPYANSDDAIAAQPWYHPPLPPSNPIQSQIYSDLPYTNIGGGGGAGAGGPHGVGGDGGDLRAAWYLLNLPFGNQCIVDVRGLVSCGGGGADGGQKGGNEADLLAGTVHSNGLLLIPGDGGDDGQGNVGGIAYSNASLPTTGFGGGGGGTRGGLNLIGGSGGETLTLWTDTDGAQARNNFSPNAGPGGGGGGAGNTQSGGGGGMPPTPVWSSASRGGPGGLYGGGGGGGGENGVTSVAFGGQGVLVLVYAASGTPPSGSGRRWIANIGPIHISSATPPTITSDGGGSTATVAVDTGDTAVTTVTASGTPPISYAISGGANAALFDINATSGALTFKAASVDGSYQVIVEASNIFGIAHQTITANVAAGYHADAVNFDGNTYFSINALTASDSKFFALSLWFKGMDWSLFPQFFAVDPDNLYVPWGGRSGGGTREVDVELGNAVHTGLIKVATTSASIPDDTDWHNLIVAIDTTDMSKAVYVDRANVTDLIYDSAFFENAQWSGLKMLAFGDGSGGNVDADIADYWIMTSESLFVAGSVPVATLNAIISPAGKPMDPAGFPGTPLVLFSGNASTFATNQGNGGAFSLIGDALTNAGSSPSD